MCMMKRCLLRLGCLSCSFLQGMTNINHSWLHHWQHGCTFVCALFCTEQSVVCFCQAVIGSILNSILWSNGRRDPHQDMVDSDVASIVWFDPSVKCSNFRCSLSIEPVVIPSHVEMAHPRECGRPHEHSAGLLVGERCNIWHCLLGMSKWYKRQPAQKSRRSSRFVLFVPLVSSRRLCRPGGARSWQCWPPGGSKFNPPGADFGGLGRFICRLGKHVRWLLGISSPRTQNQEPANTSE